MYDYEDSYEETGIDENVVRAISADKGEPA